MYVILNVSLRNDAIVHCHDRLRAMWRSPARRNRSVAAQILCPCVPRSKCWVLREGQRAARLVQARPAAHRSRSACRTEVLRCQRRLARSKRAHLVAAAPGAHRASGVPRRTDVGRRTPPRAGYYVRNPRVYRRLRGRARESRRTWLMPSGRSACRRAPPPPPGAAVLFLKAALRKCFNLNQYWRECR